MEDPESPTTDSQTTALIINVIVGVPTLLICLFLFDFFRKRVPSVFEARRRLNELRDPLDYQGRRVYSPPSPSYRMLGWLGPVFHLKLDTVADTHGLDAALYLRYLRAMATLFLALLPVMGLLPVYYTGPNKDLPEGFEPDLINDDPVRIRTLGIQKFSLANVPADDAWRFWVTLAFEYFLTYVVCGFLWQSFKQYSKDRRRYRAAKNPANYAILVQDIPKQSCSEQAIFAYWNKLFPGQVARVYHVHDGAKLVKNKAKFWAAVTNRERAEWDMAYNEKLAGARPTHKNGACACCRGRSAEVDSIEHWAGKQQHYENKISVRQKELNLKYTPATRAAIVVFKTRRAAAVAAQTSFANSENVWRVSRAPEPRAVNYASMGIPGNQLFVRKSIMVLLSVLLTLFWIIPVTFIMSLANLSALAAIEIAGSLPFSFLNGVAGWSPVLLGIIEGFLPVVILSVFLSLIPTFFALFVSITRVTSRAKVDRTVRDWYFTFVVFSNFLFVAFAGTLLTDLQSILKEPAQIVDLLANAIPQQAAFIMNFIVLKALSETPQQLLQIGRVIVRWIMLKFLAKTPRQKRNVETGNTIFSYVRYYAIAQLVTLLGVVYSTIQPFIIVCCFAYFCIMYLVWKYNLCYSLYNPYQDGGRMYGGALYGIWIALFAHLLTMVGLFGLNKNPAQSALIVIPAVKAVIFLLQLRKSFSRILEHGSVLETHIRIEEEQGEDHLPDDWESIYIHPGFEPLPEPVENLNGVDGNSGYVTYTDIDDLENPSSRRGEDTNIQNQPAGDSVDEWKDAISGPTAQREDVYS